MNKRLGTLIAALVLAAMANAVLAAGPTPQPQPQPKPNPAPCSPWRRCAPALCPIWKQCAPAPLPCGGPGQSPCRQGGKS